MSFKDLGDRMERALGYARAHDTGNLSVIGLRDRQVDDEKWAEIQVYNWDDFKLLAQGAESYAEIAKGSIHIYANPQPGVRIVCCKALDNGGFAEIKDDVLATLGDRCAAPA